MSEENKAVYRRWGEEVFNKRNFALIDELIGPGFRDHSPVNPSGDLATAKNNLIMFLNAFSDIRVTIDDLVAEGDKVVARYTAKGTHLGELMGIPPTEKSVTMTGIEIIRFSGGKMVEHWEEFDQLGVMQQLGVIPTPG